MEYRVAYQVYTFNSAEGEKLQSPEHVYQTLQKDYNPTGEEMHLLITNIQNKLIEKYLIAKGSYNTIMITPADMFNQVLRCNARAFILAHNHPSGDVNPSREDILFTKKVEKAADIMGISFMDHLIYNHNTYYSFKKNGIL
jgi:DNA repair protein RadC